MVDIDHLLDLYQAAEALFKDDKSELIEGYEVALRSAWVLIVTYWESYIEDICTEAVEHIVSNIENPDHLPKALKKSIAKELKNSDNEIAMWQLASEGWRYLLKSRLKFFGKARNNSFNSPKSEHTKIFFSNVLAIEDITQSWKFEDRPSHESIEMIDQIVRIRGQIAHRGKLEERLTVEKLKEARKFISDVVSKTGGAVNKHCKSLTKTPLWEK